MRFVYCAASICTFIDSFDGIDTEKMVEYILKSQTYEGKNFFCVAVVYFPMDNFSYFNIFLRKLVLKYTHLFSSIGQGINIYSTSYLLTS